MQILPQYQPIFRELGLDAEMVFSHELIQPWRKLPDRENCTLDATLIDGRRIRWHVKRYPRPAAADAEIAGHRLLIDRQIPTATLIASGKLEDGRSFVIFDDLAGYRPADKLLESHEPFDRILHPTADLAARLHRSGLHHRDLYLCHFMIKLGDAIDVRLIDTARVRVLPRLFAARWIVKDLAQFWYSTTAHAIDDERRDAWLNRYAQQRGIEPAPSLRRKIARKAAWIKRHDVRLRRQQPHRNVSIPTE